MIGVSRPFAETDAWDRKYYNEYCDSAYDKLRQRHVMTAFSLAVRGLEKGVGKSVAEKIKNRVKFGRKLEKIT